MNRQSIIVCYRYDTATSINKHQPMRSHQENVPISSRLGAGKVKIGRKSKNYTKFNDKR